MKVKTIQRFLDKIDKTIMHEIGEVLEWDDPERVEDCVKRGLVEVIEEAEKPKKSSKKAKQ